MTSKALVVLSGGADSTTCLGWALTKYEDVACVTFDYGQRHRAEVAAAAAVINHFERMYGSKIPHEVVEVPDVLRGTSPLVRGGDELATYASVEEMTAKTEGRIEATFVPMRNTLFLTLAANRAVTGGISTLVTGVCQEDSAGYPDCRQSFVNALADTFDESLGKSDALLIETPLMHLSKAESVRLALKLPHTYAALAYSHTAYDGQYPPTGKDHASVLRAHGFEQAGVPDPLVLRAHWDGLMPLPKTQNYHAAEAYIADLSPDWAAVTRAAN